VLGTIDDATAGKPEPEGYLQAASRIGLIPAQCLVVEDSAVGVAAGRAAGARVAALNTMGGDLPITELASLAEWLRSALARHHCR
jgi:sugar-phosphatase